MPEPDKKQALHRNVKAPVQEMGKTFDCSLSERCTIKFFKEGFNRNGGVYLSIKDFVLRLVGKVEEAGDVRSIFSFSD